MVYNEQKGNLFEVKNDYTLAHCISTDCSMGAGIAVEFEKKFHIRSVLLSYSEKDRSSPACIRARGVFNLITKRKYYQKPTYLSVTSALELMKAQALELGITKIAMPKIASGLDRLSWPKVREIIKDIFSNTDIEILICYI